MHNTTSLRRSSATYLTTKRILGEAYDLDDIACLFLEEELGRHDWVNNWKQQQDKTTRLTAWVSKWHPGTDVAALQALIDKWATKPFNYA